jgi:hypothetical protein
MADILTLKGERAIWIRFVARVKERRKTVWQALEPFLKQYLKER